MKDYFQQSTNIFLTLAIPGAIGLAILSQPLLKTLATAAYMAGWQLVLMIAIGALFLGIYQINMYIVYLVKQTKWLPLLIAAASATSAGINMLLIPRIGIMGAAISNMVSYLVRAATVTIWARKTISYSLDLKYLSKVIIASLVMGLCLYLLKTNDAKGIILGVFVGAAIFVSVLLLLRGFSTEEKLLFKNSIAEMIFWKD